jgi:hypothetical protein
MPKQQLMSLLDFQKFVSRSKKMSPLNLLETANEAQLSKIRKDQKALYKKEPKKAKKRKKRLLLQL